jgi:hypothetical protein
MKRCVLTPIKTVSPLVLNNLHLIQIAMGDRIVPISRAAFFGPAIMSTAVLVTDLEDVPGCGAKIAKRQRKVRRSIPSRPKRLFSVLKLPFKSAT